MSSQLPLATATPFWTRSRIRRLRRYSLAALGLGAGLYFVPYLVIFYLVCGALDIYRQNNITAELIEKYFLGNGILTWLLSPINLLADLVSHRNRLIYRLEDLPPEHRAEVEECVRAFVENGDRIRAHVAANFGSSKRVMLPFKWYDAAQPTELAIPAFQKDYRHIKTIAVSVFSTRELTSSHFGPLRFTFRVLYNLDPGKTHDVFIQADNVVHYWADDPLFIFDDTIFHCSVNNADNVRYCLFMDMVRPTYAQSVLNIAIRISSVVAGWFKQLFYQNWSFIR